MKRLGKILIGVVAVIVVGSLAITALLIIDARRVPDGSGRYVALGSSFAAGIGLGPRAPGSPHVCMRSLHGYPPQVARALNIPLTDMTCSGATTKHVLSGGQVLLGPQLDAINASTELVTLTAGGNDVNYVGDITFAALINRGGLRGWIASRLWHGLAPLEQRDFAGLEKRLLGIFTEIKHRAPNARVVVISYPVVLPAVGTCPQIGLDVDEIALLRAVGAGVIEVTRAATVAAGVTFIDLTPLSESHNACSSEPWVNGAAPAEGVAFHPTSVGAKAMAEEVERVLAGLNSPAHTSR